MSAQLHTQSDSPSNDAAASAVRPGPSSLALSFALVPSLLIAGGLQAQTATETAAPSPAPAPGAKDGDVVELDKLEVEEQRTETKLSSPKFTQPLIDVPQTFSVVPQEVFTKQSATTLSDVLKNTPGITFLAGEGGNASSADGDSFFMRGFDASGSIFVDGVRNTAQVSRDVYNVEQVEIAKGPAGSDIGRTTPGGYVNLSTKSPTLEAFRRGSVSYGFDETNADGRSRATLDINQPATDEGIPGVAVRLNAMVQGGGVTGRETAESNRFGVAPSLAFGLGTPTRVVLSYERFEQHDLPDYGLPVAASPNNKYTPPPPSVAQDTFYGTIYDYDDAISNRGSVKIEHDLTPDTRITNVTVAGNTERHTDYVTPTSTATVGGVPQPAYDPVTGTIRRSHQGNERENENFANLTNLTTTFSTGSFDHSLSTGMELLYETQTTVSYTSVNSDTAFPRTPLLTPDNNIRLPALVPSGATTDNGIKTLALYAFDTIELSESWMLTGGARWETYDARYRGTATGGATNPTVEDDNDILSWKGGVVYKPRSNGSIYTAYSKSLRPPGTNLSSSTNLTNADNVLLDPQEADNYEIGTKWEFFQRRLALNLAGFYTENSNVATTDTTTGAVVQTNDQTVQGVEFSASGRITENWLVYGGVAHMKSEYSAPTFSSATGTDGAALQWTPEWSGNLWTTYRLPFGLTVGGGAQYMDSVNRSTTNTAAAPGSVQLTEVPDYWLFNALLEYQVTKNFAVRLNVNNLFDEDYMASLNNNGYRYNPGPGRNFVLSADFAF